MVSDIPGGDRKNDNLFLQCAVFLTNSVDYELKWIWSQNEHHLQGKTEIKLSLAQGFRTGHSRLYPPVRDYEISYWSLLLPSLPPYSAETVFLNVYGAQESIPRNELRQPM